jgi:hypothetical protein
MRHVGWQSVICGWLLRLYPARFRAILGAEMLVVCERSAREPGHLLRELLGLFRGAGTEWRVKWTSRDYLAVSEAAQTNQAALPDEIQNAEKYLEITLGQMVHAIAHHQFERARRLSNAERNARENLRLLRERYNLLDNPAA